jgi:hypothetical protein
MSDINLNNYEIYFIDYFDGNLTAEQAAELFLFLEKNPTLKEEFNAFNSISISDLNTHQVFEDKFALKVLTTPTSSSINEWLIAEIEGTLSKEQIKQLEVFLIANPQYNKDRELYKQTILIADEQDEFAYKSSLKQGVVRPLYTSNKFWYAVAAILLVLLVSIYIIPNSNTTKQIGTKNPTKIDTLKNDLRDNENASINNQNPKIEKINTAENKEVKNSPTNKIVTPQNFASNTPIKNNSNLNDKAITNKNKKYRNDTNAETPNYNLATISTKNYQLFKEEEPFVFVEKRYVPSVRSLGLPIEILNAGEAISNQDDITATNINTATKEELINSITKPSNLSVKNRVVNFFALAINKVSNNKIKVKTEFNPNTGGLAAYELEVGKNKWQKIKDF